MSDVIDEFLQRYAKAFLSFKATAINEHYEFPAILYTEAGEVVVFTEEEFTSNSTQLLEKYKSLSIGHIDFEILNKSSASNSLEFVEVMWHFKTSDRQNVYSANTNYLLKSNLGDYKIVSVFMVNEATEFSKVAGEHL